MCTVAFTGYRPGKMPFVEDKKDEKYIHFREQELKVIKRLIERGYTHFISGAANVRLIFKLNTPFEEELQLYLYRVEACFGYNERTFGQCFEFVCCHQWSFYHLQRT